jgi:hypothetical protein
MFKYLSIIDKEGDFLELIIPVLTKTKLMLQGKFGDWPNGEKSSALSIVSSWEYIRDNPKIRNYFSEKFSFDILLIPGTFENWLKICHELDVANQSSFGFPPAISSAEIFLEMKVNHPQLRPVAPLISACRSLEINGITIPDDVLIDGILSRISRLSEFPHDEAYLTIPFLIEKASSNKVIYDKLVMMEPNCVFYYFGMIFHGNLLSSLHADPLTVRAKTVDELIRSKIIANLLFVWVIQGMPSANEKANEIFLRGQHFVQTTLRQEGRNIEIVEQLKKLLSLNEKWISTFKFTIKSKGEFSFMADLFSQL